MTESHGVWWCRKYYPGHSIYKYWDEWDPRITNPYFEREINLRFEVDRDLVVLFYSKEKAMAVRTDLPDPNLPEEQWVAALSKLSEPFNMRDYRDSAKKDQKRSWMVEAARRISAGLHSKVLQVELTQIGSERINCHQMTEEALHFWKNGFEQKMSEREILDGWMAMQSMLEDTAPKAE